MVNFFDATRLRVALSEFRIHMAIAGNEYQFRRSFKQKWKWPTLSFTEQGTRLKIGTVCDLLYEISPQHAAMLLWKNGGVPGSSWYENKDVCIEVHRFLGIQTGEFWELTDTILRYRDFLPRFSIPVALVEEPLGDTAFLLNFPGRDERLWLYTWNHETIPEDPDDPTRLHEVAPTLKKFVDKLRATHRGSRTEFDG